MACLIANKCCWQDVVRPLGIDERTAVLAAAVSIDFDYFSQHSHSGGGMFPFLMPMPTPSYPPEADPNAAGAPASAETSMSMQRASVKDMRVLLAPDTAQRRCVCRLDARHSAAPARSACAGATQSCALRCDAGRTRQMHSSAQFVLELISA